ncbi:hypothetical protein MBRA1_001161 [Malassezia brasiliensis]|uniref:Uncharacterized protein n=1 Tax=Malassezia brasiliensis TaxID=1821822 RepID=A0AAF0IP58_9BASI|nr:hypothetical protein MBRA1_001161 [Malassezia brasiliensis]
MSESEKHTAAAANAPTERAPVSQPAPETKDTALAGPSSDAAPGTANAGPAASVSSETHSAGPDTPKPAPSGDVAPAERAVPDASRPAEAAPAVSDALPSTNAAPASSDVSQPAEAAPPRDAHVDASGSGGTASADNSPRLASSHAKKFSSLNINQRFLQNASAAAAQATHKPVAPAPAPVVTSRLTTMRPTVRPAPRSESPMASWANRSSAAAGATSTSPTAPAADGKGTSTTGGARTAPWAAASTAARPPPASRVSLSSEDFPTAAEALEAKRKAEERAAEHAAKESAKQQAALKELDRFRGTDLPTASHWDEMDEESEESLDDVVEFGDGKQYKISHDEPPRPSPPKAPEPRRGLLHPPAPNAWGLARSTRPDSAVRLGDAGASRAPAPAPASLPTWGPLAQRHSTLTGQPLPKPAAPKAAPTPAAPAEPKKSPEEIAAEQQTEMLTAAERARRRREEDERAREAERERARARAHQIEEQLKAAERAKKEALEAEKRAVRERRERERAEREKEARERLAREDAAKERARKALAERQAAEAEAKAQREAAKERAREARRQAKAQREAAARAVAAPADDTDASWRRATPPAAGAGDAGPVPGAAPAAPRATPPPPPPEPSRTREELPSEQAPVWRQFRVQFPAFRHHRRAASDAAQRQRAPRDGNAHACACDPPWGFGTLRTVHTEVEWLFPPAAPAVHLPRASEEAAGRARAPPEPAPSAHARAPLDQDALVAAIVGDVDTGADAALFADEALLQLPAHLRRSVPRVKLPTVASWRAPRTFLPTYASGADGARDAGLFEPRTHGVPLVSLPDRILPEAPVTAAASATWGAGTLGLPLLDNDHHLKRVWSSSAPQSAAQPKNSLEGLVDDTLPEPVALHELHDTPHTSSHELDAIAAPFQPAAKRDEAQPWPYLARERTNPTAYRGMRPPYTTTHAMPAPDQSAIHYMLPADYSDFVLSDTW